MLQRAPSEMLRGLYICNLNEQFPKGTKVQNLKLQVCSGMYDLLLPPCIRGLN